LSSSVPFYMNGIDASAARIGPEPGNIGVGQQRDIGVFGQHRINADHLRIGLAIQQTGKSIERAAAHTDAGRRGEAVLLLIEQYAERKMKRLEPDARKFPG